MKKLGVVLQYEIMTYLKNKSYVISTVIIAVIAAAIMLIKELRKIQKTMQMTNQIIQMKIRI